MGLSVLPWPFGAERRPIVVFRYDDFCATSPRDLELRLQQMFRAAGAEITFGVIPFAPNGKDEAGQPVWSPLDAAACAWLRAAAADGTVEVAVHGFSHDSRDAVARTEFGGLAAAEQLRLLQRAHDLLRRGTGVPVETFIPPWNSYDRDTLAALVAVGCRNLSADKHGPIAAELPLRYLPATCTLSKARDAIHLARHAAHSEPVVTVVLHPNEFRGDQGARHLQSLAELLAECRQAGLPMLSVATACDRLGADSASRCAMDQRVDALSRWLPAPVSHAPNRFLDGAEGALHTVRLRIGLLYGELLLAGWLVLGMVRRRLQRQ